MMANFNYHDLLNGTLAVILSGAIIGLFSLNNSVIRLTTEVKGIKEVNAVRLEHLTERVRDLEKNAVPNRRKSGATR